MFTSKIVYCLWLTLAKEDDNFVIQTTKPLPEFKNLSEQEQIRFIRERILGKSNEQLVQVSDFILLELSILLFMMNIMRMMILVLVVTGMTNFQGDYEDDGNRTLIKSLSGAHFSKLPTLFGRVLGDIIILTRRKVFSPLPKPYSPNVETFVAITELNWKAIDYFCYI